MAWPLEPEVAKAIAATEGDMLADLRAMVRMIPPEPPLCTRIIARHDVPFGRVFPYYPTNGGMWAYVSRGWVRDLPRREFESARDLMYSGIPVTFE